MTICTEQAQVAKNLATQHANAIDSRLGALVSAIQFVIAPTGELTSLHVMAGFRSWHRYFGLKFGKDAGEPEPTTVEALADSLVYWVQRAIDRGMLSLDDSPRYPQSQNP